MIETNDSNLFEHGLIS